METLVTSCRLPGCGTSAQSFRTPSEGDFATLTVSACGLSLTDSRAVSDPIADPSTQARDVSAPLSKTLVNLGAFLRGVGFGRRPFGCNLPLIAVQGCWSWRCQNGMARSQRTSLSRCETAISSSTFQTAIQATYYKPAGRSHLILRERTRTDDHELLDEAFQAAVAKVRELGWIV